MSVTAPTAQDVARVEAWVTEHLSRCGTADVFGAIDIGQVAVHPHRRVVACGLLTRRSFTSPTLQRVALVDLEDGSWRLLELPTEQGRSPTWSADGRLAVVGVDGDATTVLVLEVTSVETSVVARSQVPGQVETCAWSPDGARLALQVAMPGAEISDVYGAGLVPRGDEPWRPRVLPVDGGRRVAMVWDPASGTADAVSALNVWELVWAGDDSLLALTSQEADEGAWYSADLTRIDLATRRERCLLRSTQQLAQPRAAPDDTAWSVLSGVQSDRGLPAGVLLVGGSDDGALLPTDDVYVNDHHWLDGRTVQFAGLRGLETVVARVDVPTGHVRTLWSGAATSGEYQPEVTGAPGRPPVIVLEEHDRPPTLGVVEDRTFRPVLAVDGDGPRYQAAHAGSTTSVTWHSTDQLEIEGLLTVPDQPGPHALVLHVHGGPTHAWRRTWLGRDPHTSALVARGYAVLRPNPRGSTGRGAEFAEHVHGDIGGLDADDLICGVEHLVAAGVADPDRLGVTGISYGGYMASWLTCRSDLFAAAVARSPATDWVLQHLTSNIAEFDRQFLRGDPFDPDSLYTTRNPLRHHEQIATPTLLTAGLLDLATPPSQAQVLYSALARRGVPTQLAIYPQEGHGVRRLEAVADQIARTIAWFERFMPPGPR